MNIIIYLMVATFLYVHLKTKCRVRMKVNGKKINPTLQEIILIVACYGWIISIPMALIFGKIQHE